MAYASGAQANMWNAAAATAAANAGPGATGPVPGPAMPYIGAKISLISSAGIRYEGALANVDPETSTIGLHNVRTYGTEGRKADYEIQPSDDVYDYIVFRGKDILDLTVSEPVPTPPDDPAILMCTTLPSPSHNVAAAAAQQHHPFQHAPPMRPPSSAIPQGVDYNTAVNMMAAFAANQQQAGPATGPTGLQLGRQAPAAHPGVGPSQQQHHQQQQQNNLFRMLNYQPSAMPQYPSLRYDHQYLSTTRRGGFGVGRGGGRASYGGGPKRVTGELTPRVNESLKTQLEPSFNFEEWNRKFEKVPVHRPGAQLQQRGPNSPPTGSSPPTEGSAKTAATTAPGTEGVAEPQQEDEKTTVTNVAANEGGVEKAAGAVTASAVTSSETSSSATTSKATSSRPLSVNPVYDKGKSFFDNISCEALDRQAGYEVRVDRTRQRQLDVETFGPSAANPIRRGGRGYRRGGGGGYSRGIGSIYNRMPGPSLLGPHHPMGLTQHSVAAMMHQAGAGGGGGYPSYPC